MLDIDSYLPYQGKVVLKNKKAKKILARIPRWVRRQAIKSTRNGSPIDGFWLNNYLVFDRVADNDIITIEFPMVETEEKYQSGDIEYTCRFKGNTLVDISPRDERPGFYPMYNRDEYQNNEATMKNSHALCFAYPHRLEIIDAPFFLDIRIVGCIISLGYVTSSVESRAALGRINSADG